VQQAQHSPITRLAHTERGLQRRAQSKQSSICSTTSHARCCGLTSTCSGLCANAAYIAAPCSWAGHMVSPCTVQRTVQRCMLCVRPSHPNTQDTSQPATAPRLLSAAEGQGGSYAGANTCRAYTQRAFSTASTDGIPFYCQSVPGCAHETSSQRHALRERVFSGHRRPLVLTLSSQPASQLPVEALSLPPTMVRAVCQCGDNLAPAASRCKGAAGRRAAGVAAGVGVPCKLGRLSTQSVSGACHAGHRP
jgi:hypothetical protein